MDPDYILFVKVAELGSLSAAGRALAISPAMMSKRIARLEARLGIRLLRRTTRKLALTDTGGRLYGDIAAILAAIQEAEDRATARLRTVSGVLRVSVPTSFGRLHIAPHIGKFLALYPDVDLSVDLSDTYVDLLVEPVDLAIRITNAVPGSCEGHHLAANRRILCASPAYIARHGTPRALSELTSHRLIAAAGQAPWRLINGRTRRVIDFKSKVETNSSEMVRELALSGVGIALRSLWDVGHLLASGALRPVLPEWEAPRDLAVYAVHLRGKGRPAPIDALVAFLKTIIDDRQWE